MEISHSPISGCQALEKLLILSQQEIDQRTAAATRMAIIQMLTPYRTKTLTITCDNGKEFADHQEFVEELDADVYFAHAYSSWERG